VLGYYSYRQFRTGLEPRPPLDIRMKQDSRRIDQILSDAPLAAGLFARLAAGRRAALAIAPACAELAPDFDPLRPGSCDLRLPVLQLWLRSGAQSVKLRQSSPRLLALLQAQGLEVNEIRFSVQPVRVREKPQASTGNSPPKPSVSTARLADTRENIKAIQEFASKLALTLPESSLRSAAERLGRSVALRVARIRESDEAFEEKNEQKKHPGPGAGQK